MLLLVLACLSCVLLAWLRCAFGAAFSSTAAYFAIKPMHAPHRPTILLNCHSDNFVRLALQDGPTAEIMRQSLGKTTGFGTAPSRAPTFWQNGQFGTARTPEIPSPGTCFCHLLLFRRALCSLLLPACENVKIKSSKKLK